MYFAVSKSFEISFSRFRDYFPKWLALLRRLCCAALKPGNTCFPQLIVSLTTWQTGDIFLLMWRRMSVIIS